MATVVTVITAMATVTGMVITPIGMEATGTMDTGIATAVGGAAGGMASDTAGAAFVTDPGARKFLLSGLLKCGCCGGGFTIVSQDRYGCATRRSKGTCANKATVSRQEIEERVLGGLKGKLLAPELVREFIRAFQDE